MGHHLFPLVYGSKVKASQWLGLITEKCLLSVVSILEIFNLSEIAIIDASTNPILESLYFFNSSTHRFKSLALKCSTVSSLLIKELINSVSADCPKYVFKR